MKVLVVLLALITPSLQSGEAVVTVKAYNATGETYSFALGSRVLLTCDVELPMGSEVVSYKWQQSCTRRNTRKCELQGGPYYRVVNNTLLVDLTSTVQRRMYYCKVEYQNQQRRPGTKTGHSARISVTGSSATYLLTPTSVLLNHSLITDITQAGGKNRQHWINCTNGRNGERAKIFSVVNGQATPRSGSSIITFSQSPRNGLYVCFRTQSKYYFSLYIRNSTTLPTPTVSVQNTVWTMRSPNGSPVERYIVEFECRVRNITFVEKYMSVSANSGGTGPVVMSESCFGELGRLYRVKVWAVSGPNISRQPAVKCLTSNGQCREEGTGGTTQGNTDTPPFTPPIEINGSGIDHGNMQLDGGLSTISTSTGVGVGVTVGVFLFLVLIAMVVIILVVVVMRRKAAYKQKGDKNTGDNLYYNNTVVVRQENEMTEKGPGADYDDVDNDKAEEKGSIVDPYEDVDRKAQIKTVMKPASKESPTTLEAANVGELYAIVEKTKKKGAKKEEREDESAITKNDDLYAMPMKKKGKMTDRGNGVVESGGVEEGEETDNMVGLKYEPKADSESGPQVEGDSKAPDVDMLYAVVDKSHKKKK